MTFQFITTNNFKWIARTFLVTVAVSWLPIVSVAAPRVWNSADRTSYIVAEAVRTDGTLVVLKRKTDGRLVSVPLSKLSLLDQKFVQKQFPAAFTQKPAQPAKAEPVQSVNNVTTSNEKPKQVAAQERSEWSTVAKVFPEFRPFMIHGVPAIGANYDMVSRERRNDVRRAEKQIDTVLNYLTDREGLKILSNTFRQKGFKATFSSGSELQKYRISWNYSTFQKLYGNFYPVGHFGELMKAWTSTKNEFQQGEIVAKFIEQLDQKMAQLEFPDEGMRLCLLSPVELKGYDYDNQQFPLRIRGPFQPQTITRSASSIETVFPVRLECPQALPAGPTKAREIADFLDGRQIVFKQDLLLSNFRQESISDFEDDIPTPRVNAKVIGISLVAHDDPNFVIYQWKLNSTPDKTVELADELSKKMQQISQQHGLKTIDGYPAIRADYVPPGESNVGSDINNFGAMLDRVALGLDEDYLSPLFVANHFPEAIGNAVRVNTDRSGKVYRANWAGESEFDQREVQAAFAKQYSDKINAYKIDLPIRFTQVDKVELGPSGRYDFQREGISLLIRDTFYEFVDLPSARGSQRDASLIRMGRPQQVQQFIPMSKDKARSIFNSAGGAYGYLKRTVTWDTFNMKDSQDHSLPAISEGISNWELYADPLLKNRIAVLEVQSAPPSILSNAEPKVFPTKDQPLELNSFVAFVLGHQAAGSSPEPERIQELAQKFQHFSPKSSASLSSLTHYLSETERRIAEIGTASNPSDDQLEEMKELQKEKEELFEKVTQAYQDSTSPFFPYGLGREQLAAGTWPELAADWFNWYEKRIESSERHFKAEAFLGVDPLVRDLYITNSMHNSVTSRDKTYTQELVQSGLLEEQILLLPDLEGESGFVPCIQWETPIMRAFDRVPEEVRNNIVQRMNGKARLVLTLAVNDMAIGRDEKPTNSNGLILKSRLISYRVYNDNQLLFDSGVIEDLASTSAELMKSVTSNITAKEDSASNDQEATPLTPTDLIKLMAKFLPEEAQEQMPQLMLNRWRHENDFRARGYESEYGVRLDYGIYFPAKTASPSNEQLTQQSEAFSRWLQAREAKVNTRYSLKIKTRFASIDTELQGYPRALQRVGDINDLSKLTKVTNFVNAEIAGIRRSLKYKQESLETSNDTRSGVSGTIGFGGNAGSGSAPSVRVNFPENTAAIEKTKEEIARLQSDLQKWEMTEKHVNTGSPLLFLTGISNRYALLDAKGNHQINMTYGQTSANWDLAQQSTSVATEPIHTVIRIDRDFYLPTSMQLDPQRMEFPVEFEFTVQDAAAMDQPPERFNPKLTGSQHENLKLSDHGRYLVYDVHVESAWLLDPTNGKRLHALPLRTLSK